MIRYVYDPANSNNNIFAAYPEYYTDLKKAQKTLEENTGKTWNKQGEGATGGITFRNKTHNTVSAVPQVGKLVTGNTEYAYSKSSAMICQPSSLV